MATTFPDGFLWGTATAAHQVEGNNWNNDWWAWEHAPGTPCEEPSGDACDQFNRYLGDLDILCALGFDAYRFSVEWSRIEPEEGEFSNASLDHYARVLEACRERDLLPVVTLHHFTTPRWAAADGAWANPAIVDQFTRFTDVLGAALGTGIAGTIVAAAPSFDWSRRDALALVFVMMTVVAIVGIAAARRFPPDPPGLRNPRDGMELDLTSAHGD